jgi:hypothetical protein
MPMPSIRALDSHNVMFLVFANNGPSGTTRWMFVLNRLAAHSCFKNKEAVMPRFQMG